MKLDRDKVLQKVLDKKRGSHSAAILILEEIVDQYNLQVDGRIVTDVEQIKWKIDYKIFDQRFGFSYPKVKSILKLLSKNYHYIAINNVFIKDEKGKVGGGSESFINICDTLKKELTSI